MSLQMFMLNIGVLDSIAWALLGIGVALGVIALLGLIAIIKGIREDGVTEDAKAAIGGEIFVSILSAFCTVFFFIR